MFDTGANAPKIGEVGGNFRRLHIISFDKVIKSRGYIFAAPLGPDFVPKGGANLTLPSSPPGVGIEHQPYPVSCRVPTPPLRAPLSPPREGWYLYPLERLGAIVGRFLRDSGGCLEAYNVFFCRYRGPIIPYRGATLFFILYFLLNIATFKNNPLYCTLVK